MSVSKGTNASTGTANTNEVDTKAAKAAAAAAAKTAKSVDDKFCGSLKSIEGGFERVAQTMLAAKDSTVELNGKAVNVWRLCVDADGTPFKSWNAYLSDRLSKYPTVHTMFRGPIVKLLLDNGLSMREAAKALNVSPATVSNTVNGRADAKGKADKAAGRTPRTAGDGTTPQPLTAATKALKSVVDAGKRLREDIDIADLPRDVLVKLAQELKATHDQVVAQIKLIDEAAKVGAAA